MSAGRVIALRARHAALEATLASELRRPFPDESLVRIIKRRKLSVKDEIARIRRH